MGRGEDTSWETTFKMKADVNHMKRVFFEISGAQASPKRITNICLKASVMVRSVSTYKPPHLYFIIIIISDIRRGCLAINRCWC